MSPDALSMAFLAIAVVSSVSVHQYYHGTPWCGEQESTSIRVKEFLERSNLSSLEAVLKKLDSQHGEIAGLYTTSDQQKEEIKALEDEKNELQAKNENFEIENNQLVDKNKELEDDVTIHKNDIDRLRTDIKDCTRDTRVLKSENERLRELVDDLKTNVVELNSKISALTTQLENEEQKVRNRERERNECFRERNQYRESLDTCHVALMSCHREASPMNVKDTFPSTLRDIRDDFQYTRMDERQNVLIHLLRRDYDEQVILKDIDSIFQEAYSRAKTAQLQIMDALSSVFHSIDVPETIKTCVIPYLQSNYDSKHFFDAEQARTDVFNSVKPFDSGKDFSEEEKIVTFVDKLIDLSWKMVLFDPQLSLGETDVFDSERFDRYPDSTGYAKFQVWPSMEEGENVVAKGEVWK